MTGNSDFCQLAPRTIDLRAHISAGNINERGRERTAAGMGTVGRRWAGGRGRGRGEAACLLTLARVFKGRLGRGAYLLNLAHVSYVF